MDEVIDLINEEIEIHKDAIDREKEKESFQENTDIVYHDAVIQGLEKAKEIIVSICGIREAGTEAGQYTAMPGA